MTGPPGPLRVCPENPRWFADASDRPLYLAGSHHWDNLVDNAVRPRFDFEAYLARLRGWGHNAIRLWCQPAWTRRVDPVPYLRTGPGLARDGGPRFDLRRFDGAYFSRLRRRVERAGEEGMAVVVMLFQGWSLADYGEGDPWRHHPYHRENNVNGLDGDPDGRGDGLDLHSLRLAAVTRLQEAYVARVAEAVGDLPNVLYEIANESPAASLPWQRHMLGHLRGLERARGRSHPLGLTAPYGGGGWRDLAASSADWISPGHRGGFRRGPPPAGGGRVVLLDSDHLWGIGGDRAWAWKAFTRGYNLLYMDPLDPDPVREETRRALGAIRGLADGLDLRALRPAPALVSGGFCLAAPEAGREIILAYLSRGRARVDLRAVPGELTARWLDPGRGRRIAAGRLAGGARRELRAPAAGDAVLLVGRPSPGEDPRSPALPGGGHRSR